MVGVAEEVAPPPPGSPALSPSVPPVKDSIHSIHNYTIYSYTSSLLLIACTNLENLALRLKIAKNRVR